ncbi:MAG: hypothetical protein AAGA61_04250 [Pseudomonadota bacterium]
MYRLLGFCLGSVASVSALMFLIGWPDFHLSGAEEQTDRYDMAVQKLKAKQHSSDVALNAPRPDDAAEQTTADKTQNSPPPLDTDAVAIDTTLPANGIPTSASDGAPAATADVVDSAASKDDRATFAVAEAWHTIWTPFRSRIAADGFVSRLESVTGLDYRVRQIETGAYEVAFAYVDQADLDTNLARIAAATGLELGTESP